MPFILAQSPTYRCEVTVYLPKEAGGWDENKFTAVFKRVETEELKALNEERQEDVVKKVLRGWHFMLDEHGKEVAFTEENLAAFMKIPQAVNDTAIAFWRSVFKGKEKN